MNQLGTFHDMHPTLTSLQILEVHWISHFCFGIQTIFVDFMFEIIYFGTQTCLASQLLASSFFFVFKRRCDRLLVNLVGVGIGNLLVFFPLHPLPCTHRTCDLVVHLANQYCTLIKLLSLM